MSLRSMWMSLALLCASMSAAESPQIPILAWIGIPAEHTSPERYEEMAAAGFTIAFQGYPNLDALMEALDVAEAAGVQLIAGCPELRSDTATTVERMRHHPALYGYVLRDEPGAELFPMLAEWVEAIQAVDDTRWAYINLFPNYASAEQLGTETYREHVRLFLETVPQKILSFDHYPVVETADGILLRSQYYENLRIIREEALRAGVPFWAFALSVAHVPYPVPEETHLRVQQFSNLLYGAQGLQYFTYWTPTPTEAWNFNTAPIERDGTRTVVYDRVKAVTSYLQGFAAVFIDATVEQVGHMGASIPPGAEAFEPGSGIVAVDSRDSPIVVSHLRKGERAFLAILNPSLEESIEVGVTLDEGLQASRFLPADSSNAAFENGSPIAIEPADVLVLEWIPSTSR